jgi:hypothetical protein
MLLDSNILLRILQTQHLAPPTFSLAPVQEIS